MKPKFSERCKACWSDNLEVSLTSCLPWHADICYFCNECNCKQIDNTYYNEYMKLFHLNKEELNKISKGLYEKYFMK